MNFLTRLAVAALALAFMAIAPARAQTVPYGNLSQSTWVSIGTGPLAVTLNTTAGIYWLSASSQPSASVIGNPIDLSQPVPQPVVIPGPGTIWVRAIQSGGASIQVTPAQGGATTPLSVANLGTASFASPAPITVTTSATPLAAARTGAAGTGRVAITITCVAAVAIGPTSGVTFAGNAQIPAGAALTLNTTSAVYGIASGSSTTCNVWETF